MEGIDPKFVRVLRWLSPPSTIYEMKLDTTGNLGIFLNGLLTWQFKLDGGLRVMSDPNGYLETHASTGNGAVLSSTLGFYDGATTAGEGFPIIFGVDARSGLTSADGAPITLYAIPVGIGAGLFRISADIFATAVTAGTANYTISWTENAGSRTMVVSASLVNTLASAVDLINPDASTSITAQLTFAGFTGTVKVGSVVELIAHG